MLYKAGKKPLSLAEIISQIPSAAPHQDVVHRLLSALVRAKVIEENPTGCFMSTGLSKWLAKDQPMSLAPLLAMTTSPQVIASFNCLSRVALEGGNGFEHANGRHFYDLAGHDPEFNEILNSGMISFSAVTMAMVLEHYNGFKGISKLVDVGGGSGACLRKIVQTYPDIQGVVFDLPHVIDQAPKTPELQYIGGDMFDKVPSGGDAIFIKSIFHNWDDEKCLILLKNCYDSLPVDGKLVIVDMIFNPVMKNRGGDLDLMMLSITGGKERSEEEWKELLLPHGFSNVSFQYLPTNEGIIEAHKTN